MSAVSIPLSVIQAVLDAEKAFLEDVGPAFADDWQNDPLSEAISALRQSLEQAPSLQADPMGLTIAALQRAHVERQEEWCPDQKPDLSFRGNELGGECGEAQNVIKKLERERLGWRGSRDTVEHLGEELADVIHCAILCAITAGIDIEQAVVSKFNSTSEKNGLSTFIAALAAMEGSADTAKPCGISDPSTRDCPNMKEAGGGMDGERYRCAVCGKGYFLDYQEMK